MTVFWFLAGLFAGVNAGIAYTRIRSFGFTRSVAVRVGEYTRPDLVRDVLTRLRERLQTDTPDPGKPW